MRSFKFYDTHAHYDDERFDPDRDEVLKTVREAGCERIINIGCTLPRCEKSIELARRYDFVYATVGIHPSDVVSTPEDYLDKLRDMTKYEKVVAIGEIGLDYTVFEGETPDKARQERFFTEQIALARELSLPIIIHSRDATEDTLRILKSEWEKGPVQGVMHCYSYSAETAKIVLDMGLHISFTGVLTFKNAKKAVEALKVVPLRRLLTETDAPYMSPEPERGKRNDSGKIKYIIEKIAEIKGVDSAAVAAETVKNAQNLFNLFIPAEGRDEQKSKKSPA
jgi:TatD DNase family protein